MRQPDVWTVTGLYSWIKSNAQFKDGQWVPCRPLAHNAFSFRWRWKLAWKVLIGAYDAVRWEE